jgi:hypothetical protein
VKEFLAGSHNIWRKVQGKARRAASYGGADYYTATTGVAAGSTIFQLKWLHRKTVIFGAPTRGNTVAKKSSYTPTKIWYAVFVIFTRATCLASIIFLHLIILIIFCEEYKL